MNAVRALYVTDRWDGPYRYRCQQACEQLRADGAVANVAHVDAPDLLDRLDRYGVIVLFRLPYGDRVEAIVKAARVRRVPLLFDIDDLTFDPRLEGLMPFRRRYSPEEWANTYGRQMAGLRRTFDACDAFVGSTPELAEHARRLGKRAHVHPNVAPAPYLRAGKWAARLSRVLRVQPTIGYFSGSDTHDEDFGSIAPAIEAVLAEDRSVRLLIVGHLELGGRHPEIEQRVVRLPYMHWREFAFAYAACHVTLAPLATVNEFTSSKSALKFFEAGAFSTPVVATPAREMASAIEPGKTGWLARSRQDWVDAVMNALDPETSVRVGKAARAAVEKGHSSAAHRGRLLAILQEYAVPPRGAPEPASALEVPDENGPAGPVGRALRPGRAARDFFDVVRAARREVRPEIDIPRLDRILDLAEEGGHAAGRVAALGGYVLCANDLAGWRSNDEVLSNGALPGERASRGTDPYLTSPALAVESARYRYVVLRHRGKSHAPSAKAQFFWKSDEGDPFAESASVTFAVATDGLDRTYVLDLHRGGSKAEEAIRLAWERAGVVTSFRIDPLDRPGSFRVGPVLLLSGAPALDDGTPRTEHDSTGEFVPASELGKEAFERALSAGPGRRIELVLAGPAEAARERLGAFSRGQDFSVERLSSTREGSVRCVLRRTDHAPRRGVDIVIPIYNARALVERCVESVARRTAHAEVDYRIVLVNDASTDEALVRYLADFAGEHERAVLLTNPVNLGFVRTANRGMRRAAGRDVLLLNSDTEVFEGFLEGLREAAYSDPHAGLCSPLSNNATICSVPDFCSDNSLPADMSREEMAALVARTSRKLRPTLVTPHGFCLYLRADMLETVGLFEEELFGRGFGEENDLGERAKAAGFDTVLADDVYVWHAGKASFGEEGRELERRNGAVLSRRHPTYHPAVAAFVRDNPLLPVQETVRRHFERRSLRAMPACLYVLHANPFANDRGGVEHCVRDLVRAVRAERAVLAYPRESEIEVAEVLDGDFQRPWFYRFTLEQPLERFCHEHAGAHAAFEEILSLFHVGWAHVHHLMFLPLSLATLLSEKGMPYVVTGHDFYSSCPSFNLLDVASNVRCCPASACDAERTNTCQRGLFEKLGQPVPADPVRFVAEHRRAFQSFLERADRVLFPSPSAAHITGQLIVLDRVRMEVVPHGFDAEEAPESPEEVTAGSPESPEPLRVAVIGQVAYASKGADSYLETMARLGSAPIEWHVFGRTDLFGFDQRLSALGERVRVVRHGPYLQESIVAELAKARVDLGLLLPAWPETYSYTLSELLAARVPVVARRIGALADRLDGAPGSVLVEDAAGAAAAIRGFERDRRSLAAMRPALAGPSVAEWGARHRALYTDCARRSPIRGPWEATPSACARLNEVAVSRDARRTRPVTVTGPAPEVAASWWYRHAERAKPYVPESLRQITRRRLARDGSKAVLSFRLPSKAATLVQQLTLERRYLGTAQLTSHGTDPYILLEHAPFDPKTVKLLRFNLWCSTPSAVHAQLYFRHEGAPTFDEHHSITIPLNGALGQWQEYVTHIEATDSARAWYEGGAIVSLRFDPIDVRGPVGLGELSLCDVPAQKGGDKADSRVVSRWK